MKTIKVNVKDKIAIAEHKDYVCDNSDYQILFEFDLEWDDKPTKTARFKFGKSYIDVVFSGNVCDMPKLQDINVVEVGVFAGNVSTTTPAYIHCRKSIRSGDGSPIEPTEDVYDQIIDKLNTLEGYSPKIVDGNWWEWDKDEQKLVDTEIHAQGDKGETGNSGVYIGSEAPTDESVRVWIDTSSEASNIVFAESEEF